MQRFIMLVFGFVLLIGCGQGIEKKETTSIQPDSNRIARLKELEIPDSISPDSCNRSGFRLDGDVSTLDVVGFYFPVYPVVHGQREPPSATIVIQFSVDSQGNVLKPVVIQRSSGYPEWDEFLEEKLASWKFIPSEKVKRAATITFRFVP